MRLLAMTVVTVGFSACFGDGVSVSLPDPNDGEALSWGLIAPGTVFETSTLTRLRASQEPDGVTFTRHTLLSTTPTEAELELEVASDGVLGEPNRVRVPLQGAVATPQCPDLIPSTALETVTVPAGTFECTRSTFTFVQDGVTRTTSTWTARGVPVPIKWTLENENFVSTTELSRIARR